MKQIFILSALCLSLSALAIPTRSFNVEIPLGGTETEVQLSKLLEIIRLDTLDGKLLKSTVKQKTEDKGIVVACLDYGVDQVSRYSPRHLMLRMNELNEAGLVGILDSIAECE